MLTLARDVGQEIIITAGEDRIRVVVLRREGDKVYLGIDAPKHIPVHRGEVQEELDKAGRRFVEKKDQRHADKRGPS